MVTFFGGTPVPLSAVLPNGGKGLWSDFISGTLLTLVGLGGVGRTGADVAPDFVGGESLTKLFNRLLIGGTLVTALPSVLLWVFTFGALVAADFVGPGFDALVGLGALVALTTVV